MFLRILVLTTMMVSVAAGAFAQQRPLVTEDPEVVGAGRLLLEGGVDVQRGRRFPVSGLEGNLLRMPTLGVSVGISSIAELQIDGGLYDRLSITNRKTAPLSSLVTSTGAQSSDVSDIIVATKIRMVAEATGRPAVAVRFATKLPNASNESGLGLDTTDFFVSLLIAKNVQSFRFVGNGGVGILGDPTSGNRQNDVVTYSASIARALTRRAELVGDLNGRLSLRDAGALPGTENQATLRFGGRYTPGPVRFDGGVLFGLTDDGPNFGITGGFTYVFDAFQLP